MEKYNKYNPHIATASGKLFHLINTELDEITVVDIAHALSNLCRFTGHTRFFYSVAQHSVYVAEILPLEYRLWGLLHDATEAYLGDVNSPLKSLLPDYQLIEDKLMEKIAKKFHLDYPEPEIVQKADLAVFFEEIKVLMPKSVGIDWGVEPNGFSAPIEIYPMEPDTAYHVFLDTYVGLTR